MTHDQSAVREVAAGEGAEIFRALSHPSRTALLALLAKGDLNVGEIAEALSLSQPSVTKHVQVLEKAGLVRSDYRPGLQGMQKRCHLVSTRLHIHLDPAPAPEARVTEVAMPIGLYTLAHPNGTCGLATRTKIVGFLDKPLSFFDPERAEAQILWMSDGFVEYTFPNDLPTSVEVTRVELVMEVCSEAPNFEPDWPSDLTVSINGVELGAWTCPGDYGGERVARNPEWWPEHMTQHGLLKIWSVDEEGASVDGSRISDVDLSRILVIPQTPVTVRIGVRPDAENVGGFNLFGSGFGRYGQDLVLRIHYAARPAVRAPRRSKTASESSDTSGPESDPSSERSHSPQIPLPGEVEALPVIQKL